MASALLSDIHVESSVCYKLLFAQGIIRRRRRIIGRKTLQSMGKSALVPLLVFEQKLARIIIWRVGAFSWGVISTA